jgi:two-component system response regulator DesR
MPGKIFIIEPHPVHRESYAFLVNRQPDLAVCGVVGTMRDAERVLDAIAPDLAMVNLASHAVDDSLGRIRGLRDAHPSLPLLVVSTCATDDCAEAAVGAGATAYLPRTRVPFDLISCIREILSGSSRLPRSFTAAA